MAETLDSLETRPPAERERDLMERLPQLVVQAQSAPGWINITAARPASNASTASK